jgi:hypothetical protein
VVLESYVSIRRASARHGTLDQQVRTALMLAAGGRRQKKDGAGFQKVTGAGFPPLRLSGYRTGKPSAPIAASSTCRISRVGRGFPSRSSTVLASAYHEGMTA